MTSNVKIGKITIDRARSIALINKVLAMRARLGTGIRTGLMGIYEKVLKAGWKHEDWFVVEGAMNELISIDLEIEELLRDHNLKMYERIKAFVEEVREEEPEFVKDSRVRYLRAMLQSKGLEFRGIYMDYGKARERGVSYYDRRVQLLLARPDDVEREMGTLKMEIRIIEKGKEMKRDEITPYMVVKAREYPIENLINVGKGKMANCPFHSTGDQKTPSFYVKNNFGFCFSCGESADTIDLIQKLKGLTFVEAIRALQ